VSVQWAASRVRCLYGSGSGARSSCVEGSGSGATADRTVVWEGFRRVGLATEDDRPTRGVGVDGREGIGTGIGIEMGWSGGR